MLTKNPNKIKETQDLVENELISTDEIEDIQQVEREFSIAITSHMSGKLASSAIASQFVPSTSELNQAGISDPIGDNRHSPIKGIVHRHKDRCLLMPINICAVYCRFCFRREKLGEHAGGLTPNEINHALDYIKQQPSIWEVILSGGDPLLLSANKLNKIFSVLNSIPHVEVIRIHTRIPVVSPEKITDALVQALKIDKPVYIVLHANHADEFDPLNTAACAKLIDNGIPMLSQSVLLKGINDNETALSQLMKTFVKNRIKPYYLHHMDKARGTKHFETTIAHGQKLSQYLRANLSGLCQPTYVLDIPGGYGKVPLTPCYCEKKDKMFEIKDYQDRIHRYG